MLELKVAHTKPYRGASFILYGRVSTKDQLPALEAQLSFLRRDVIEKKGKIVAELRDVGTGALTKKRPGYKEVIRLVRGRQADYLFVRDVSRLGRRHGKLEELWHLCRQNNVVIMDTQVGVVNELHLWALGLVAQLMRGVQGEQVRNSLEVKARNGLRLGGRPYGYECVEVDGERGHLEIIPSEAKVVRRIFKRTLKGMSLRAQAQILNFKEKVPAPRGGRWSSETVRYILSNVVYRKGILWGTTRTYFDAVTEDLKREAVEEVNWISRLGAHKPLVSASKFDQVQSFLARYKKYPGRKKGPPVFLSSLLKCPSCSRGDADGIVRGGSLSVTGGDGRRFRMRCSNFDKGKCNNHRTFYREQILQSVLSGLVEQLRSPEAASIYLQEYNAASKRRLKERGSSRTKIEKQISTLSAEIKRLTTLMARGYNPDSLSEGISLREKELEELKANLADIENSTVTFNLHMASVASYAAMAEKMLDSITRSSGETEDVELREHLESLVQHVFVHPLEPKGFEVEVFGKLATLVTGQISYRAVHRKGSTGTDTLTGDNLTIARAAEKLVVCLSRSPATKFKPPRKHVGRRPEPDLTRILSRSAVPLTASMIAERLANNGVRRNLTTVHLALARRPEPFVRVRHNGFMLRSRWEEQPVRYFLTTTEIVEMARQVLDKSRKPMRPKEMLAQFHAAGRRIYAKNELNILPTVLTKHHDHFEAKGRNHARWTLRAFPEAAFTAAAA